MRLSMDQVSKCLWVLSATFFVSHAAFGDQNELIHVKAFSTAAVSPGTKIVAGNLSKNEFYIVGKSEFPAIKEPVVAPTTLASNETSKETTTIAAPAIKAKIKTAMTTVPLYAMKDGLTHKPVVAHAHEYASIYEPTKPSHRSIKKVAMKKKDVIRIEMAFKSGSKSALHKKLFTKVKTALNQSRHHHTPKHITT